MKALLFIDRPYDLTEMSDERLDNCLRIVKAIQEANEFLGLKPTKGDKRKHEAVVREVERRKYH